MAALTPLEIASGLPLGVDPEAPPLPPADPGTSARRALEAVIAQALRRQPCVVAFSGGRDSSAMLAVAVDVARREGLPEPVAFTMRFPDSPRSNEDEWQELVIAHLGVREWERVELRGDLDVIGPHAREDLLAHGVAWPANAHSQAPIFEFARGGSVITGLDGDGAFGGWYWKELDELFARPASLRKGHLRMAAYALAPNSLGERDLARRWAHRPPWLRPGAAEHLARQWARHQLREPVRWRARVERFSRLRYVTLATTAVERLAGRYGVQVAHPILAPAFLAALGAEWRPGRFSSRTRVMRYLFGDLLPAKLIERGNKAEFGRAFYGEQALQFARSWDGESGVDTELVDSERLRSAWLGDSPVDFRSSTALQSAWLASHGTGE